MHRQFNSEFATDNTWASLPSSEVVDVISLSDSLSAHPLRAPALLKLDIQGFEEDVLRASADALDHFACVQMEMAIRPNYDGQPDMHSNVRLLESFGFAFVDLHNGSRDCAGHLLEIDGFFTRIQG